MNEFPRVSSDFQVAFLVPASQMRHSAISDAGDIWLCIKPYDVRRKKIYDPRNPRRRLNFSASNGLLTRRRSKISRLSRDYIAHKLVEGDCFAQPCQLVTVAFSREPGLFFVYLAIHARRFLVLSIFWAGPVFETVKEKKISPLFFDPSSQVENREGSRERSIVPGGLEQDPK